MDQYVSWSLSSEELMLDTIWEIYEEFCKPQSNEVRARFDLLKASGKATSQLMNGTMQYRLRLLWIHTPQKQPRYFTEISFGFFLEDEEFVSKTIDGSNTDLDKFPKGMVRQLAKKMESSKVTSRHIK